MGALGAISVVNGGSGYTTAPTVTISPAAPDPVSTRVAQTFTARMTGIAIVVEIIATGKTLWEMEFEAGANGASMTYAFNGKQYVIVAIGGQRHAAELVALSLP